MCRKGAISYKSQLGSKCLIASEKLVNGYLSYGLKHSMNWQVNLDSLYKVYKC